MLGTVKHLWHSHRILLLAFTTATVLTLFFATRMVTSGIYWADPAHQNQPLEGWMTPRYVALSYGLNRDEIAHVLEMEPDALGRIHLRDLLPKQGLTLAEVQARVDAHIAARPTK